MQRAGKASAAIVLLCATAACTTFGTNVRGSFQCEGPQGVCAPSIAIDDQALGQIQKSDSDELLAPAGPYRTDDGDPARSRMAGLGAGPSQPGQVYQLSVIFPAYTDFAGTVHARKTVAADVGLPGRTANSVELAGRARGQGSARGLLAAAQSAPILAPVEEIATSASPALAPVGAAATPAPIDRIKAEVDARLSSSKRGAQGRRQAAAFPSPEKEAMSIFDNLREMILGDGRKPETTARPAAVPMLSHFLGYRSFDEDRKIFYQVRSKGFILELAPLIGGDERIGEILGTIFADVLTPGCTFNILNYASPRIAEKLGEWVLPRVEAGGVFATLARHRADKLRSGAWQSLATDGPFLLRNFRVLVSVGAPDGSGIRIEDLLRIRDGLVSALDSINVPARLFEPVHLIRFFDEILCASTGAGDDAPGYNRFDPINQQCVRRDLVTHVEKDRLLLHAQSLRPTGQVVDGVPEYEDYVPERFDVRTMSIRNFPDRWAPWDTQKIIGDVFNPKLCLPCPTLQSVSGIIPGTEASEAKAGYKFARTQSLSEGQGVKLVPKIKDQAAEWRSVQDRVKSGEKLIRCYYAISIIAPRGTAETAERAIKGIYKAAGWDLIDETHIQLPVFMAHFPLMVADGLQSDLERMKRFRTMLSSNVAAIAPLQGEFVGGHIPHVLFIGRRGQPQFWSPFQNKAGNHNVAIAGKSGSGKSVFLQDLTASLAGVRAKTIVIDDGRSFEHMAKALGGTFTEFKLSSGISINPFRMIDVALAEGDEDYLVDCLAMLKAIVSQMARYENRLNDTERGLIDKAVNAVWNAHQREGTVDLVIAHLEKETHDAASNLAMALLPFSAQGTYGRFFLGASNLDLSADLTVFELSDLSSREELRSVVLTSIMFVASQTMRRMSRSIPKALLIDEAWQMLKGGAMADFVETYSRTCRKYGASLITATQSINDYYKSDGSRAALENSDWFVILQQKPETIADFKKSDRFEMTGYTEALMRSLKRNGIEYSDVLIRGPETETICRLVLDAYSGTLYSSSPDVFARIETLVHQGYPVADAIERVAFPDRVRTDVPMLEAAE